MDYPQLADGIKQYVTHFFKTNDNASYVFHNLSHTESVVANAKKIADHYRLYDKDLFAVIAAAWFHDAGYLNDNPSGHESRGAEMATAFLKENGVDDETIMTVRNCILATQFPQDPQTLPEQIICDADLFHFGTDDFSERNKLMHKEAEILQEREISKKEWRKITIRLLEQHHYFTDYCQLLLAEKQQENLDNLKRKDAEKKADESRDRLNHIAHEHSEKEKKKPTHKEHPGLAVNAGKEKNKKRDDIEKHGDKNGSGLAELVNKHLDTEEEDTEYSGDAVLNKPVENEKIKKRKKPERGIDTVFKITSNNNQRLSSQADSKAHIMIQVNSIIISVLISMLFRKIEDYRFLSIPAIMLLFVNVFTIIFSVLATRPQIPQGIFSKEDIENKKVNLLFFGNFYKMTLEDYASGMLALMEESDFLYMSLIRDVYFQGKVLGRKYHLLRISYNVFMYGLVLSVIAFIIAFTFFSSK